MDASNKPNKVENREITSELKESYLDYALSVIVSRALPDARDGLKPVQRRILWAMWDMGLTSSAKPVKSARVVGETLGKYHPHGDLPVYEAMVRMAQEFSLRYPLIQGQGNFGSVDGDSAAAQRYTEVRLSKIASELLVDIEKETVEWQPNYDSTRQEPKVLPARLPNLLLNGTSGIAVGMATNIPPHNLNEVAEAAKYLIDNPKAETGDLAKIIQGPDFPTGGIIYNRRAMAEAYSEGKGAITCRAVAEIEERKNGQFNIIVTEIPYQVNKAELITKIAELVQEKKIEGIRDLRDESDREGMRIVIELKNDAAPQKILNQLYNHTDLQKDFHLNMLALVDGVQPKVLSLKEMLSAYVGHRQIVVRKRTEFDLKKAEEREHILEGLVKALAVIDQIIETIKKSADREEAHSNLVKKFKLTSIQANAILEMRLATLAALEQKKLEDELVEKRKLIADLKAILANPKRILGILKDELSDLVKTHGDPRRTKVVASGLKEFREEDLVPQEEAIITLSQTGYIKRLPPDTFRMQKRGGKGTMGLELKEEDFVTHFISADTHDNILFFTDRGKAFQTKVYEIPEGSRVSKGKLIQNFLDIPMNEKVSAILAYAGAGPSTSPVRNEISNGASSGQMADGGTYLVMATRNGLIKKTALKEFENVRRTGIIAIRLKSDDRLKWVKLSSGKDGVILITALGQAIRFKESDIRGMGRAAAGVRGIRLGKGDAVVGIDIIQSDIRHQKSEIRNLLVVMANGFGKQTALKEYKVQSRGGKGIKTARVTPKTGEIIAGQIIDEHEELYALSAKGQVIRTNLKDVRVAGRATQGVKVMNLKKGDKVTGIVCL